MIFGFIKLKGLANKTKTVKRIHHLKICVDEKYKNRSLNFN